MTTALSSTAPEVLHDYYRILEGGTELYQGGAQLRELLSPHLDFTGSLAGHRPDSSEGFLRGVAGFIGTVESIDVVQDVHADAGSAVLYDATLPGGVVRFAEFFTLVDGRITTLQLHYDGQDYVTKGGR